MDCGDGIGPKRAWGHVWILFFLIIHAIMFYIAIGLFMD